MARKKDLIAFAKKYKLKIGTIEDLIKYKIANEKTIKRISEEVIATEYGKFTSIFYEDTLTSLIHFVLVKNQIESESQEIEIIAEELRNILRSFDGLLGLVDTEEVLGEIFANFCIGK